MREIIKRLDKKLKVTGIENIDEKVLLIHVESTKKTGVCPCCSKRSNSIHSKYHRKIKDLPIQEEKVILDIEAKVFFCKNKKCTINTFAEQFDFIESHSRMTTRLKDRIVENSKGMSARASKTIINEGLAEISDDTILRLVKKKQ